MAEVFVRTIKRDYAWINHYNQVHQHKALGYRSPREFIAAHEARDRVRSFGG
jgi:putative transposase